MKFKKFLLSTVIMLCVVFFPVTTHAAQKRLITLSPNHTYTQYDVTSDGKNDKLKIVFLPCKKLQFYINNKKAYSPNVKNVFDIDIELCTLSNKNNYIHLKQRTSANDYLKSDIFLTYKSGKLVTAVNTLAHTKNVNHGRFECTVSKVNNSTIRTREQIMFYGIGLVDYYVTYKPSGNKLVPTSNIFPLVYDESRENFWTTATKLKVTCLNHAFISVPPGDNCKIYKIKFDRMVPWAYSPMVYMKFIKYDGSLYNSCWLACSNNYTSEYFLESVYI